MKLMLYTWSSPVRLQMFALCIFTLFTVTIAFEHFTSFAIILILINFPYFQCEIMPICQIINRLKHCKSLRFQDGPEFLIKGHSVILIPVHSHIFNFGLT
jgi:hypothetical protein